MLRLSVFYFERDQRLFGWLVGGMQRVRVRAFLFGGMNE